MWHYLESKENKLWIWKAIDHATGELIDWECGDRSEQTAALLIDRLNKAGVKLYIADDYAVYANLMPVGKLYQGKDIGLLDFVAKALSSQNPNDWLMPQWRCLRNSV
ncbi:insertion element IS1 protein InsB [Azospirillaceae bacterium]